MRKLTVFVLVLLCAQGAQVLAQVVDEPNGTAYHFVKSYRVHVLATPAEVWPHVMNLGGWMYDFEMTTVQGVEGQVGAVVRLYEGQDFMVQLTALEVARLMVMANLPMTDRGETGTGIGVTQLTALGDGTTEVSLVMSRRYDWSGTRENVLRETRQSAEFNDFTDEMWLRFLNRLKAMAEGQ